MTDNVYLDQMQTEEEAQQRAMLPEASQRWLDGATPLSMQQHIDRYLGMPVSDTVRLGRPEQPEETTREEKVRKVFVGMRQTATPPASDWETFLQNQHDVEQQHRHAAIAAAFRTNADEYAKNRQVAGYLGYPVGVVEATLEESKFEAEAKQLDANVVKAPVLARRYTDEDFAKLAREDSGMLSILEDSIVRGWQGLKQNLSGTALRANSNSLESVLAVEAKMARGERVLDTEDPMAVRFMSPDQRAQLKADIAGAAGGNATTIATAQAAKAKVPPPEVVNQVMQAKGFGEAINAFTADPVRFVAAIGPESLVQNAPGLAVGAVTPGGVAARAAVAGAGSFSTDYGSSLLEALGKEGVDLNNADALQAAAKNPALMRRAVAQAMAHASVVGLVDALSGGIAGKVALPAKALATRPLARELANVVVQTPVQGALGGIGEAGGELAAGQSLDPGNILAEVVGEGFGTPAEVASIAGGHVRERMARAREAKAAAQTLQQITDIAAQSKLRQRDPQAFADFVRDVAAEGPVDTLYINGRTLAQSAKPEDIAKLPAQIQQDISEAAQIGGDVAIPLADYATHLADNPELLQHVRTTPEAMTLAEANAHAPDAEVRAEVEAAIGKAEPVPNIAEQTSASALETIRAAVLQQLEATGRFTPDVNEAYAELITRFAGAAAQRSGITPEAFAQIFPLSVVSQLDLGRGATLDQDGSGSSGQSARQSNASNTDSSKSSSRLQPNPPHPGGTQGSSAQTLVDGAPLAANQPLGPNPVTTYSPGVSVNSNANVSATSGTLAQAGSTRRGAYNPDTHTIALLEHADLSTFLHEAGHFFLEVQAEIAARADAPAQVKADMQTLLDWFGVPDLATWRGMTLEQKRDSHEKFARGFEAYLFEGKAPSEELAGVFQRFRAWLLNVYKSLTQLNVELTPEVRQVFDRMLATEAEVENMQAQRSYRPLFESAEAAGMTAEEWTAYQRIGQQATEHAVENLQARSLNDMRWLSNAKSRELKKLQRDAAAKQAAVQAEVRAEVEALPIYQAWQFLLNGKLPEGETLPEGTKPLKLATPVLKEIYGDGPDAIWHKLPGNTCMLSSDPDVAVHPDVLAEMFGLSSGDELVRLLTTLDSPEQVIEGQTDQRMLERYGTLSTPAGLERAAEAAIHNDARGRFLEREVGVLDKAVGNKPLIARAARQYAGEAIANKKVRDIRPAQFAAAEGRAAKAAAQAFKAGDTAAAAASKRDQMLQHELARAAGKALDEVESAVRYLKGMDNESARKSIDPEYSEQIDAILEKYDLRSSVSNKALAKRESLAEWIKGQQEMGFEPVIDEALLADTRTTHYRDLKLEELRGVRDAVRNIEHLGRLKQKLLTVQDQRTFDAMVSDAASSIKANATQTIKQQIETNLPRDRAGKLLTQYLVSHRKLSSLLRQMDGGKDAGAMWSLITRGMNKAGDTEAVMRAKATEALTALFEPLNKASDLYRKTFIPEIGGSLTRAGRLSVALNWGNAANRQRVLDGDRWSTTQVQAILDTLNEQDWHFVQGVWDYLDSFWPEIAAKEKRVSGVTPEKVTPTPVHTKFGELRGGYYPIKYDPDRSTKASSDSLAEAVKQSMQGLYTRATTRRGHTKERVESVVNRPVRKDLGAIFEHVEQVSHDLAWHEFLIDANRLLRAKPIDAAIREHYGPEVLRTLSAALSDIAAGDIPAQGAFEQGMKYLRTGVSVASMGWSLVTAFQQPLGLTQSMVRIGPKWVGRGVARWLGDATRMENTAAWIRERSDFMRLRAQTQSREIAEIRNTVQDSGSWHVVPPAVKDTYFYFTEKMQQVADIPTWLGAYEKAQAGGHDEATSVALADQAVIDSQSSGGTKDLAAIQRGSPTHKLFTMFYSAFSATYNLSAESVARTNFKKPGDVARLAVDFLLLYTVPAMLGMALKDAMRGDLKDYQRDKIAAKMAREQLNYLLSTLVGVREFGATVMGSFGYSGPAGARLFADAAKLSKQAAQGEVDKAAVEAANSVGGVLFHYPALQVQRTGEGIAQLLEGHPSLRALLFGSAPRGN